MKNTKLETYNKKFPKKVIDLVDKAIKENPIVLERLGNA